MKPIILLNAAIITTAGSYQMRDVGLHEARSMVRHQGFSSAIGHAPTASVMTELLGVEVVANRVEYLQRLGDVALVFRLNRRLAEGQVLKTVAEIATIGYSLSTLKRTS